MPDIRLFASVRSVDPAELGSSCERLLAAGVDGLHVDLADGRFVPELGYGPDVAAALAARTGALVDVHVAAVDPEAYLGALAAGGVRRVSVHLEATPYPWRTCGLARSLGLAVGLAANPATAVAAIATAAPAADFVNLLTTEPDLSGERLLPRMVERVAAVRAVLPPEVGIEVDGGIDVDSAGAFAAAGAEALVVGRAISAATDWNAAVARLRVEVRGELWQPAGGAR